MTQGRIVPPFVEVPPPIPAPPPTTLRTGLEADNVKLPIPLPSNIFPRAETPVYTTRDRRKGIDVFVAAADPSAVPRASGMLVVRVYARSSGSARALVASGMVGRDLGATILSDTQGAWVCAARAAAEIFDVTIAYYDDGAVGPGNLYPSGNLLVACAASDEVTFAPDDVGVIRANAYETISASGNTVELGGGTIPRVITLPNVELVGVAAVNGAAAARYLQAFNTSAGVSPGDAPTLAWPLGAVAGGGIVDRKIHSRFSKGLTIAPSTTPNTYTAANDCYVQAWVR